MNYESAKQLASSADVQERRKVAADVLTVPEILYFLADDGDVSVRRRVAENRATPRQADLKLTGDGDETVRTALAIKISSLIPDLPALTQHKVQELTYDVLRQLAKDQAVRVREILADALQSLPNLPPDVINRLARDVEIRVAEPVLKSSPVLSDADLLDIINNGPIAGALAAIAKRSSLTEPVSAAIASSEDNLAIAALLANPSAQIREDTLTQLCERAPARTEWHEPLVHRPKLPLAAIKRLASFVATRLLEALQAQPAIDSAAAQEIADLVRKRIDAPEASDDPATRVHELSARGELDEPAITAALESGQRAFVVAALAHKAGTDNATVHKIMSAHSAKGMTALAWKAGLSMRLALQLQTRLAGIAPQQALYPKGGSNYPLSDDDLKWQLEFFGIST
jgi:uncharacterized protein (DUF2336 family)